VRACFSREVFERSDVDEVFSPRGLRAKSRSPDASGGREDWKLNKKTIKSLARPFLRGLRRRSSAVPSGAEGKQAGYKGRKLNSKHVSLCRREACPREVSNYALVPQAK
jgi:hypothetical protein